MKTRVITSAFITLGLIIALLLREIDIVGLYIFDALIVLVGVFAVNEVLKVRSKAGVNRIVVYAYLICALITFYLMHLNKIALIYNFFIQVSLLCVFILYAFFSIIADRTLVKQTRINDTKYSGEVGTRLLDNIIAFVYPGMLLLTLIVVNHIGDYVSSAGINAGLFALLMVFAVACTSDVFAYLVGINFGGPKLCPKISPKKTYSGAIGGLLGGVVASLVVLAFFINTQFSDFLYSKFNELYIIYGVFVILGLLGSVISQLGDILASIVKRRAGVKDYGNILPGHGGVMDRMDAISTNSVFMLIMMLIILI
ncbi:MAG: phosphatidate cytidylyltransferase [Firmicutes bacterium]|nr:phosphatidate cytidylyltransferase [Bacillota bacterium]